MNLLQKLIQFFINLIGPKTTKIPKTTKTPKTAKIPKTAKTPKITKLNKIPSSTKISQRSSLDVQLKQVLGAFLRSGISVSSSCLLNLSPIISYLSS